MIRHARPICVAYVFMLVSVSILFSSAVFALSAGADISFKEGNVYIVKKNDTLWEIAELIEIEGLSTEQVMTALRQYNKAAFINGNINLLKEGAKLLLPDRAVFKPKEGQLRLVTLEDGGSELSDDLTTLLVLEEELDRQELLLSEVNDEFSDGEGVLELTRVILELKDQQLVDLKNRLLYLVAGAK